MTELTLYNAPVSTCSQKVRMCLHEKGLEWNDRLVDLRKFEQLSPEYLALNPNGVVPTLVHEGAAILDSSVIIEYLDEVFPDPSLSPQDFKVRAQMRAWMRYFEEVPTQAIRVPTFNKLLAPALKSVSDEEFNRITEAMPVRKQFYRRMDIHQGGFNQRDTDDSMERLKSTLARVNTQLQQQAWLCGEIFTLADITLMPTIVRMDDLGLSHLWQDLQPITRWYETLQQWPSFAATFYSGTRIAD